ncbi:MAG: S41 family peptidase [Paludibacteraceae bacterium]|nr:S41 family peptidase [Paludibacteraceae bacterium]
MKTIRQFIYLIVSLILLTACHEKEEMTFSMDPEENIEALWQIIDTRYCYVESKGVDWNSIHDVYLSKAAKLPKNDQFALFDLCAQMLDTLKDGHVNLYSAFDKSRCSSWYDTYPANFNSELQQLYLRNYRIAGGLYYCTICNDSIGYIYYSSFSNAFSATNLYWIFTAFSKCRGIIIDVRNNGGGDLSNAYKLSSPFFSENKVVGYWQHKNGTGHNDFSPLEELKSDTSLVKSRWLRPVVVLANRHSYSATNSFISMMRYADNAAIVGGVSGGGGGMPMSYELPCGWTVRFSSVRMYDRDKKDIEQGIAPHVPVDMISTDKDDIIEKAIQLIKKAK